ncbi:NOB1 family endonuclease [Caldiplasma sukawensis]
MAEKVYVPDTSAILAGKIDLLSINCIIPWAVIGEIRKGKMGRLMRSILDSVTVRSPDEKYVAMVKEQAGKTGDKVILSRQDIEVIATAIEYNGEVITDDYAIQNVCLYMGVPFSKCNLSGINSGIIWEYVCCGCGRKTGENEKICDVCGHRISRKPSHTFNQR